MPLNKLVGLTLTIEQCNLLPWNGPDPARAIALHFTTVCTRSGMYSPGLEMDSETLAKYYLTSRATRYYMGHRGLPTTARRIFFVSQHLIYSVNSARGYTSLGRIPCVNLGTHNLPNSFPLRSFFGLSKESVMEHCQAKVKMTD